mmetsp:Transcript_61936/g.195761  ORF Transcript_61936/g.195761 Transcript_61936/m.195761 type:complete len:325 (+) Transcript_61936:1077-2051(+)
MRVGVEEARLEQLSEVAREEHLARFERRVLPALRGKVEVGEALPHHPLGHQHLLARQVQEGLGGGDKAGDVITGLHGAAEAIHVTGLVFIVELLDKAARPVVQHAQESLGLLAHLGQGGGGPVAEQDTDDVEVQRHRLAHVGALDLDCHIRAVLELRLVHLTQGGRRHGRVEGRHILEDVPELPPGLALNDIARDGVGKGGHAVLQLLELLDERRGEEVGAHAGDLGHLDVGRAELRDEVLELSGASLLGGEVPVARPHICEDGRSICPHLGAHRPKPLPHVLRVLLVVCGDALRVVFHGELEVLPRFLPAHVGHKERARANQC